MVTVNYQWKWANAVQFENLVRHSKFLVYLVSFFTHLFIGYLIHPSLLLFFLFILLCMSCRW